LDPNAVDSDSELVVLYTCVGKTPERIVATRREALDTIAQDETDLSCIVRAATAGDLRELTRSEAAEAVHAGAARVAVPVLLRPGDSVRVQKLVDRAKSKPWMSDDSWTSGIIEQIFIMDSAEALARALDNPRMVPEGDQVTSALEGACALLRVRFLPNDGTNAPLWCVYSLDEVQKLPPAAVGVARDLGAPRELLANPSAAEEHECVPRCCYCNAPLDAIRLCPSKDNAGRFCKRASGDQTRYYEGRFSRGETSVVVQDEQGERPLPLRLDVRRHSPTGHAWGYGGSGPSQLALDILCEFWMVSPDPELGTSRRETALRWYPEFKAIITRLDRESPWILTSTDVLEFLNVAEAFPERLPAVVAEIAARAMTAGRRTTTATADRPERGRCPLCSRTVDGARLGNQWLPKRGTQHDALCPNFPSVGTPRPYYAPGQINPVPTSLAISTDPDDLAVLVASMLRLQGQPGTIRAVVQAGQLVCLDVYRGPHEGAPLVASFPCSPTCAPACLADELNRHAGRGRS